MTSSAPDLPGLPYGVAPVGRLYRLPLPYTTPPRGLYANVRSHWSARSRDSRAARENVSTVAKAAGLHLLPEVRHIVVRLSWAPGDRRRRDAGNLFPFSKALIDGLTPERTVIRRTQAGVKISHFVGIGLVPDDTPVWVTELAPVLIPPPERGMWLDVWVQE